MREIIKSVQPKGAGGGSGDRTIPRASIIADTGVVNVFFTDQTVAKLKSKGINHLGFEFIKDGQRIGIKMGKPDLGFKGAVLRNYRQQAQHVHCPNSAEPRLLCDLEGPQECEEEWEGANILIYWLPDSFHFEQPRRRRVSGS